MKKGISIWAFPENMDMASCMHLAKQAGYEGIELALNETGPLGLEASDSDIRKHVDLAKACGLEITSLATGLYWSYSLTSESEAVRKKGMEIARRQLEAAALLEVDAVLVVPGAVGVDFLAGGEVVPYDVAYDRAQEAISRLAPHAEACKVRIGVENVWNKFLLSPLEMRNFIDAAGSPWVGAYFDVGNVLAMGYPEHWIPILGERICRVHVKDFRRSVGTLSGFVDLLSGDVDFPKVMNALKSIGYDGWVTAEISDYGRYPGQSVRQASKAMDVILERN